MAIVAVVGIVVLVLNSGSSSVSISSDDGALAGEAIQLPSKQTLRASPKLPDLVSHSILQIHFGGQWVTGPIVIRLGDSVEISPNVANQGLAESTQPMYLSTNIMLNGIQEKLVVSYRQQPLPINSAGGAAPNPVFVPAKTGTYNIEICVDTTKTNAESDETNNCRTFKDVLVVHD